MLDEVTAALAAIQAEGTFATELGCASDDLQIEVEGVGPLRFPISTATARRLCAVAHPAPFGRRDETRYDLRVRDTLEIDKKRLTIDARRWKRTLGPELAIVRQRLGLPAGGKLEAVLDKMLVYGPGQFFAPHQDSERSGAMVGSLVVELPSRHQGGEVVVQHHREKMSFRGAARGANDLSLLAFYADCHHEVKPVDAGFRITLTYHLLHRGGEAEEAPFRIPDTERLGASVAAYFSTPVAPRYSTQAPERPDRLVYLLDHEYTEKSLGWSRLKNADRLRVAALLKVAERLDCSAYLALAEVHENWSCEDDYWDGGYGRYGRRGRDDSEEDRDANDYQLGELCDTDVELRHWVGPDERIARGLAARPASDEVCFTRASVDLDPFKSEHEGYMGNYGNTVDRWYHRAALVMWPRDRDFVVRAKVSPAWAVKQLASLLKAGAADEARDRARQLRPFWSGGAAAEPSAAFVLQLLGVAAGLGEADLAFELLSPLGPHRLGLATAPAFASLVERHGLAWSQRVFTKWAEHTRYNTPPWLPFLPRLCEALLPGGEQGATLAAWLVAREVASFEKRHAGARRLPEAFEGEGDKRDLDDLAALLEAAAVIGAPSLRDDLIAFLVAPVTALPVMTTGALLQRIVATRTPSATTALGLGALYRHLVGWLERVLAAPPRSPDDWTIEPPSGCACDLCKQLSKFLVDRDRVRYEWPLAKERRHHIHGVIDGHRLPVTHTTIRQGSPQTLVLMKEEALFERAKALRARQRTLLGWLEKQRSVFSDAPSPARAPRGRPARPPAGPAAAARPRTRKPKA